MLLLGSCLIATLLLIWFRTDAWLEYTKLLRLDCLSFYRDFAAKQEHDVTLTYILYLRLHHNCFFVRLITCPICLAVWFAICCGIGTSLVFIPIFVIGGLLLFTTIDRLLG